MSDPVHTDTLATNFELMRTVAAETEQRSADLRNMLGSFIGRMVTVPPAVWGGPAAAAFRTVVQRWEAESGKLCGALDQIAVTIRGNEHELREAAHSHADQVRGVDL